MGGADGRTISSNNGGSGGSGGGGGGGRLGGSRGTRSGRSWSGIGGATASSGKSGAVEPGSGSSGSLAIGLGLRRLSPDTSLRPSLCRAEAVALQFDALVRLPRWTLLPSERRSTGVADWDSESKSEGVASMRGASLDARHEAATSGSVLRLWHAQRSRTHAAVVAYEAAVRASAAAVDAAGGSVAGDVVATLLGRPSMESESEWVRAGGSAPRSSWCSEESGDVSGSDQDRMRRNGLVPHDVPTGYPHYLVAPQCSVSFAGSDPARDSINVLAAGPPPFFLHGMRNLETGAAPVLMLGSGQGHLAVRGA